MDHPHEKGTQVDPHRSPLPRLRAALWGRRAVLLAAFALLLTALAFVVAALASTFGGYGSEGGQLHVPRGLAVDSSGNVFVADSENRRVDEFDFEGAFVKAFGKEVNKTAVEEGASRSSEENVCPAPGHPADVCKAGAQGAAAGEFGFMAPQGVAVDTSGDVYATDVANTRVLEFASNGNFVRGFGRNVGGSGVPICTSTCRAGASSTEDGAFSWSNQTTGNFIAVDSSGEVWVGDNNRLEEFEANGTYLNKIELLGGGEPVALAADGAGNLYEKSASIAGIRKFVASTGSEVNGPPYPLDTSGAPAALATDSSNNLFVADTYGTNHFLEYSSAGAQLSYFGRGEVDGALSGIAAYHSAAGDLYASENTHDRIALLSLPAPGPLVEAQSATEVGPTSATLNASLNPEGKPTTFHFEYSTTEFANCGEPANPNCHKTSESSSIGEDFATHQASDKVEGLQAETTYHYRVVAHNPAGTVHGPDMTLTTQPPVFIDAAYTANLAQGSVDLNAEINPNGLDTHYRFEWGETEAYGHSVPVPDEDVGSETSDVLVTQHLEGLSANTTYHWRMVAYNSAGTVVGEDHAFVYDNATPSGAGCSNAQLRTNYSSSLPDCRAYEQVSPLDKNDADVKNAFEGNTLQQASVDGERVFYESVGPFPGEASAYAHIEHLASRGESGWSTRALTLPLTSSHSRGGGYSLPLSPDLSTGVLKVEATLVPGAPGPGISNLYVGRLLTGSYELVTDVNPPHQSGSGYQAGLEFGAGFVGASTDFSHVVFSANDALTPEAPWPAQNLYEWVEGQLHLVSLIPTSGTSCTGAACTPADWSDGGGGADTHTHAISADGSRIVFTSGEEWSGEHQVYDRLNGTRTVEVSASQRTPPESGTANARFQDASVDGSQVLFSSAAALTNDAVPGSGVNLYDYEVETGQLTDLTAADDVRFQGLVGVSEDASHVYFVARGVLAANSNSHGDTALAGTPNLYLWNGGQTTFIATLSDSNAEANHDWIERGRQAPRVTPDGAHLAFDSLASLTGYDNTDANTGQPDTEAYLYDAAANRLRCASCNPSGARPIGPSDLHWLGWQNAIGYRTRNLSADGSRLFFTSREALLPGDTNGLYDVYEWEADGSGGCQDSADNGGCLYLISSGRGATNSYFTDASASGNDAFFSTGDRLVGSDQDEYADLYDARVGGGFPEPPPPAPCEGESCRGAGTSGEALSAGTAAFEGPGNPHEKPCPKGKVRRHGHCVKVRKHKRHHRRARRNRRAGK